MPDEEFSFRSLIKPGQGARAGMEKEVANRAANESMVPGQWYSGEGEMLKSHGVYFGGRELPDQYAHLQGPMTHCHLNALQACEAEPSLRYFTGLYAVNYDITHHSWCVDENDEVVEVTYITKQTEGMVMGEHPYGFDGPLVPSSLGWLPPAAWAYVGLEFDVSFVRQWYDTTGLLPLLELKGMAPDFIVAKPFLKPYKTSGCAIPTEQDMDAYHLWAEPPPHEDPDDEEGWDDDDEDDA